MGGLNPELKGELKIREPMSLRKAFVLAKVYEEHRRLGKGRGLTSSTVATEPLIKTVLVGARGVPIVRKMLTIEECKERTAKDLCFNCDESYSPGHRCKGLLNRMDVERDCLVELVELVEQHDAEETGDTAGDSITTTEISLHAFSGTFNPRTSARFDTGEAASSIDRQREHT